MSIPLPSDLAGTQAPALEVRNHAGELVGRVARDKVDGLIEAGLVSPIGRKGINTTWPSRGIEAVSQSRLVHRVFAGIRSQLMANWYKYLVLNRDVPRLTRDWRGGSHTTERLRNDWGVVIGAPKSGLQHRELPRQY